jgi:uncharacterized protein YkwD
MILSLLIAGFIAAYAVRGYRRGLVVEVIELVGLIAAIGVSYLTWPVIRGLLSGWAAAFGGAVVFGLVFAGASLAARTAGRRTARLPIGGQVVDGAGGSLFAAGWSGLLATSLLLLAVTVPGARFRTARPVCESSVARLLVSGDNPLHGGGELVAELGRPVLLWVNQRLSEAFTLSHAGRLCDDLPPPGTPPAAGEHTAFTFPAVSTGEIDVTRDAEVEILRLLNRARAEAGLPPLAADAPLRKVGRRHSRDMYLRGYFAHDTPECERAPPGREDDVPGCRDPFDRMRAVGVRYRVAGENLALAPTSQAAHDGLMRSPGHRANILNPGFGRVGIGVYAGPYGLMVSQEFAG